MKRKLLLIAIGIAAVIAVSCRAKSEEADVVNTDNTNNETESDDVTTNNDAQTDSENAENSNNIESPDAAENEDSQNNSTSDETEEKRKNTYKEVDIKVPSIHED